MAEQQLEHREHQGGCKAVVAPQHPLQFQGHGFGQKKGLAGFNQLPCCLALGFGGGIGACFGHEVADQHIGVEADQGFSRLAGSKSTGTGGRWLDSIPKPLALRACSCLRGRTLM